MKNVETSTTETDVLFDGEKVGNWEVRPWRLIECVKITPIIERIKEELKVRHLTFRDFFAKKEVDGKESLEILNIEQLVFIILPQLPEIFEITLGKTKEEVEAISQTEMLELMAVIFSQNSEYLKNLFALTMSMTKVLNEKKS
jgi:hypothetical protein